MTSVKNDFQRAAAFLDRTANALHETAKEPLKAASKSVDRAEGHADKAGEHLAGVPGNLYLAGKNLGYAGAHGLFAAVDAIDGTLALGEVGLRGAAGSAIGAVASATWLGEQGMSGARFAFLNISKFFLAVANGISKMLGDSGHQMITKSLADPSAKRLSERLFDTSGEQFKLSAAAAGYAWGAYADAAREVFGMEHSVLAHAGKATVAVAGSVVNAGAFAVHSGAVLGNLGIAAVQAGATPVVLLAELGVRAAKASVLAAEKGVEASRDLTILAAEITAACGNALAHPDQAQYKVSEKTLQDFAAKIQKAQEAA